MKIEKKKQTLSFPFTQNIHGWLIDYHNVYNSHTLKWNDIHIKWNGIIISLYYSTLKRETIKKFDWISFCWDNNHWVEIKSQ